MMKQWHFIVAAGIVGITLVACGTTPPAGSKVIITPNSVNWTVSSTFTATTGYYLINNFDVLITDDKNVPLSGVTFEARLDLSPGQGNVTPLQLLDKNNNPVNSPFKTVTNEKGSYRLGVNIPLGVSFRGLLYISTGNAFASATIEESLQ